MTDMAEDFAFLKECIKERRERKARHWEPILQAKGAIWKSDGIWEYNGWLCYPTKGFGMLKNQNKIRKSLQYILREANNDRV